MLPSELRTARTALGLSAEGFALLVRVESGRTVRRWEAAERDIPGPVQVIVAALMKSWPVRSHFGVSLEGDPSGEASSMPTGNGAGSAEWADPDDAPILTEAEARNVEVFRGDTFMARRPGRLKTGHARELISARLDPEVLAVLRRAGPGWQSQINALLRAALRLDLPKNPIEVA